MEKISYVSVIWYIALLWLIQILKHSVNLIEIKSAILIFVIDCWWLTQYGCPSGEGGEVSDGWAEEGAGAAGERGGGEEDPGAGRQRPGAGAGHDDGRGPGDQEGGRTQEGQSGSGSGMLVKLGCLMVVFKKALSKLAWFSDGTGQCWDDVKG